MKKLIDNILECRTGPSKYGILLARLDSLKENVGSEAQFQSLCELESFRNNGFDEIISLQEGKWHWKDLFKIAVLT